MITYWDSFAHNLHWLLSWSALSLSSKHRGPSRAMMESSLSFTDGDLCSSVRWRCDELTGLNYLAESQEHTEGRLDKRIGLHNSKLKRVGEPLQ